MRRRGLSALEPVKGRSSRVALDDWKIVVLCKPNLRNDARVITSSPPGCYPGLVVSCTGLSAWEERFHLVRYQTALRARPAQLCAGVIVERSPARQKLDRPA